MGSINKGMLSHASHVVSTIMLMALDYFTVKLFIYCVLKGGISIRGICSDWNL